LDLVLQQRVHGFFWGMAYGVPLGVGVRVVFFSLKGLMCVLGV
jgi:hypothetical protein